MNRVWTLLAVCITAFVACFLVYDARENAAIHKRAQESLKPGASSRIDPTWLDGERSKLQLNRQAPPQP